jgi:DNA-binding winged helix-turn-helix (wHTH) protein/tetratricopeptide (TPR) repeat protein
MKRIFTFGPFELSEAERRLQRAGTPVPLAPKAFDALLLLVENSGKLVSRGQLLASVWKDVHVEEAVVTRVISDLRRSLQTAGREVWIETVPKFGYRFAPGVRIEGEPSGAAAPKRGRGLWWAGAPVVLGACAIFAIAFLPRGPDEVLQIAVPPFADNLAARITHAERKDWRARGLNPEAHILYVKGRYELGKRTRKGFEAAAAYFRQAIDLDPVYARAHAGLADCYLLLGAYSHYPQLEMLPKARATALRALDLDPALAEAHATLGLITQNLDWDWAAVEKHYRQAIALDPNSATAHHWYAEFLSILGRFEESRREFAKARRVDPISPIIQVDEAQVSFFEKDFDRTLEMLNRVAQFDPEFEPVHERMAMVYMMQGREDDAWREVTRMASCGEDSDCRKAWTAWLPKRSGSAAAAALRDLEARAEKRHVPPSALAVAYQRLGDTERALDWLEQMVDRHEVWLITAKVNPVFDSLRSTPRFRAILQRLAL